MPNVVNKPWGREVILTTPSLPYNGKLLYINAGSRISLQYHDQKTETLSLLSGSATITQGSAIDQLTTTPMVIQQGYTITPNTIHRLAAETDSLILEVSTPEAGTTFRLEDDYQRLDETESVRSSDNRGWQNEP